MMASLLTGIQSGFRAFKELMTGTFPGTRSMSQLQVMTRLLMNGCTAYLRILIELTHLRGSAGNQLG